MKFSMRKKWSIGAFIIIFVLVLIYLFSMRRNARVFTQNLIADDIVQLKTIFERINSTCGIIGFEHEKNWINFLNVGSFSGSEVGPMNLRNPRAWEGPYFADNPTIQEYEYQIVKIKEGWAIVPGEGVRLARGKKMGKEVVLTTTTSFLPSITPGGFLYAQGRPLGALLSLDSSARLEKKKSLKDRLSQQQLLDQIIDAE